MNGWRTVGIMAFFVTALTAMTAFADPTPPPGEPRNWLRQTAQTAGTGHTPPQLSLGKWLAAGLLVGLSGFAFMKRRKRNGSSVIPALSQIQINAVTKISPKAQLVVATVKGKSLLLGVTEANVTRLMWLDDDENEDDSEEGSDRYARERGLARPSEHVETERRGSQPAMRRAATAMSQKTSRQSLTTADKRTTSRFREILADAIGIAPKSASPAVSKPSAPVDELIAGAEDRYVGRDPRRISTRQGHKTSPIGPLIDVEGQAAGLVARLNRPAS